MEKLTAQQGKMVLEYFARQAAEDMPDFSQEDADKHLWMTRFQTSLAIERKIGDMNWDTLIDACMAYQSFDRDPDAYMHERGIEGTRWNHRLYLQEQVSWWIDNCWNNSGA